MKLSELGQGKRIAKEYNYEGLRLLFVEPIDTEFLDFSSGIMRPLQRLKDAANNYNLALKEKRERSTENEKGSGFDDPKFVEAISEFSQKAKESSEQVIEQLKKILPEVVVGWKGVTLGQYEEFFQTEYPDVSDKTVLMDFDPPEAAHGVLLERARRDDNFRGWLTNTIIAVSNQRTQEITEQKKT